MEAESFKLSCRSRMDERIAGLDRISELPDHLLHHILSFLPETKDLVQTRFLSRTWRRVCSSYPIFEFNFRDYYLQSQQKIGSYIKFFDNTIQRFHSQEVGMQKFGIYAFMEGAVEEQEEFVRFLDRWLEISLEKRVQEIDIVIDNYDLPISIFSSKSLQALRLSGITIHPLVSTSNTKMSSLRMLLLYKVSLKEETLQDLISQCPFIENLTLQSLFLKKIRIYGLCNLKEFKIFVWKKLKELYIDAPSLQIFHYYGIVLESGYVSHNKIKIKMGSTKNIETLVVSSDSSMRDKQLHDLISKFPLLKCLHVEGCRMLKEIKISSNRLQRFRFVECLRHSSSLVMIEIDVPNLIFFEYNGEARAGLLVKTASSCSNLAHINLKYHLNSHCFISLRKFLASSMQFKFLSIEIFVEKSIIIEKFKEHVQLFPLSCEVEPLPYKVEQLQLDLRLSPSSIYAAILDILLQICRPLTIIAISNFYDSSKLIIKYLYEALLSREDLSCCNSRHVKCWKHYLKDVKICSRIEGIEVERPLCLKTMPTLEWNQRICLILKWS